MSLISSVIQRKNKFIAIIVFIISTHKSFQNRKIPEQSYIAQIENINTLIGHRITEIGTKESINLLKSKQNIIDADLVSKVNFSTLIIKYTFTIIIFNTNIKQFDFLFYLNSKHNKIF